MHLDAVESDVAVLRHRLVKDSDCTGLAELILMVTRLYQSFMSARDSFPFRISVSSNMRSASSVLWGRPPPVVVSEVIMEAFVACLSAPISCINTGN